MTDSPISVIDVFAGPGGLGEGFSAKFLPDGNPAFRVRLSAEKDPLAHATLLLRSFFRQFVTGKVPSEYYQYIRAEIKRCELAEGWRREWGSAEREAWRAELGDQPQQRRATRDRIREALGDHTGTWVLLGGPPCQAYSVVGRSRNKGNLGYRADEDERHFLYKSYLRIIAQHWPAVFVMENVKGLLSSQVGDVGIYERIKADLENPGFAARVKLDERYRYRLYPLASSERADRSFVVECERHGIPQARHRVIILGVREDLDAEPRRLQPCLEPVPLENVLSGLPELRSGLSRETDAPELWLRRIRQALKTSWWNDRRDPLVGQALDRCRKRVPSLVVPLADRGGRFVSGSFPTVYKRDWFYDDRLGGVLNHESRPHRFDDLHRYFYAACFAEVHGRKAVLAEFPEELLPNHKSVAQALKGGYFNDRFRVQVWGKPATTITSHIAKDGHYFIHPDPLQCRSLTVREAARIQTFPDNYFFEGPRTEQYRQVGNAVPPLLARQIAEIVYDLLVDAGKVPG